MKRADPYLNFAGNTEEAFSFYRSVFGGDFLGVMRYRDFGDNSMGVPDDELDKIAHIALPLTADTILMGTDVVKSMPTTLAVGNNFYIAIDTESPQEAERLFEALSGGGQVQMPLQPTEWAEQYGSCADRFGIQWMVMYTGDVQFSAGEGS